MIHALVNHLWQSTLFVGAMAILAWVLRQHGAHLRYGLWCAASLKFLVPFSLLIAFGGQFGWHSQATAALAPVLGQIVAPFPADAESPSVESPARPTVAGLAGALHQSHGWTVPALLGLWILGGAVVVAGWLVRWLQISRAVRLSVPLSIVAPVPVRASPTLIEPGVVGVLRPILLLPQGIEDRLDAAQLRAVLLHEYEHIRRRDNLFAVVHMGITALFWFYPLLWWLGRQLVAEREQACDEAVIAAGCDREIYAHAVLNVCRLYLQIPLPCAAGIAGADLKKRVESIMTRPPGRALSALGAVAVLAIALTAALVPVALGAIAASATAAQGQAQPPSNIVQGAQDPSDIELSKSLLAQGRYADLDERVNGLQAAYKSGSLDEFALLHAVGGFIATDPSLQPRFNAWIAAYPGSYAARLARGIYYFKSGVQTRGKRFISRTTAEQVRGMRAYFEKALVDFQESLALDAKPMLSYNYLIRISMGAGTKERTRDLLDTALKLDPVALLARRPYLNSLETRWGGSLNDMLQFVEESRAAGLSDTEMAPLQELLNAEREWLRKQQAGEQAPAVDPI